MHPGDVHLRVDACRVTVHRTANRVSRTRTARQPRRAIMFTCAIPEQRFGVPRAPQSANVCSLV